MEDRYDRHIRLREFGPEAQNKLKEAHVLVVGAGGLGIPVLQYLNAMGVGTIGIAEQDIVEPSNLHRQPLYSENDVGRPKIEVAISALKKQNSNTRFIAHDTFLVKENALKIIEPYDVIVDASDNFATRYLVNDSCVILNKPFVYGALHGFEGQLCVFNHMEGPTYRCLFPNMPAATELPDCNEHGVLGVLPGIIGNLQTLEVVKIITGIGEVLSGTLLIYNGLSSEFYKIAIPAVEENTKINTLAERYELAHCDPTYKINAEKLKELMSSDTPCQLIDVRTEQEFEYYHLDGALNIPLSALRERLKEIDTKIPVYLVCQSGNRSLQALWLLEKLDFVGNIYNVDGGLDQYKLLYR